MRNQPDKTRHYAGQPQPPHPGPDERTRFHWAWIVGAILFLIILTWVLIGLFRPA